MKPRRRSASTVVNREPIDGSDPPRCAADPARVAVDEIF
jgi:hypothetical protein